MFYKIRRQKKVIFVLFFLSILFLSNVTAEVQTLGTFKQGSCVKLIQTCSNCTYNNITFIIAPDSTQLLANSIMTQVGTVFNRTFCSTGQQGKYIVNGVGDADGIDTVWVYDFEITPSGQSNLLGLFIIVIAVIYGIAFFGFFGKNIWVAMFGGMAMMLLGLFTLNNGIDVYRGFITEAFSFITIGIGATFVLTAGIEMITENL